ncbi:hypothetical protein E2986_11722 [Frieseomelitta varia]|uniref:Uncharacterized protein n=1 Tax=Frieseomelitta varia TaxID=561572 RepID=A0A833RQ67_9HYME|nr:hypothetical protein E2986_11722 [Frieseomelitta varia]
MYFYLPKEVNKKEKWISQNTQTLLFTIIYISIYFNIFCRKIGDVVYATNWYYLSNKDMLNLILIISRANSVVKITAGKMTHMCLYTFSDIVQKLLIT